MAGILNSFPRDGNAVPITYGGLITTDAQVLSGNNTTVAVPLFTIAGVVEITGIYGVVTTTLGNCTAAYFRTNDGSTQNNITLNTGVTMSSAVVGSVLAKTAPATSALTIQSMTSAKIGENGTGTSNLQDFRMAANPLATSNIEFVYTTTDTPTVGAITFYIRWAPLATINNGVMGGNVTAL